MAETELPPFTPAQERIGTILVRWMTRINTWLYRLTGGRVGGRFRGGAPICLVPVKGRRWGLPRTVALSYLRDGENVVLVASKGGMSHHPLWYLNMEVHPDVEVQIGSARQPMRARRATAEEKAALWPRLVALYPDYATYQARTTRDIPVVILTPR